MPGPTGSNRIGLFSATTLVAASMIGAGVFVTSGYALDALGSPYRVITAWMVGGVIAVSGAWCYASLVNLFRESGGEYLFLSRGLHPAAGLIAGWVSLLAGFTGPIAVAALGFEEYFLPAVRDDFAWLPSGAIAVAVIVVAGLVHSIHVRSAARIQDAIVVLKFLMIGAFVVVAMRSDASWNVPNIPDPTASRFHPLDFANQLVFISFSYAGFNAAVYVAGEVRSPERNVQRAMVLGTIAVSLIYIVLNSIFVLAAPADLLTDQKHIELVATNAATHLGGETFAVWVRCVILVALATSVSAMVMSGPRVYAKMAEDGVFPRWFRFTDHLPLRAVWLQVALSIAAVAVGTLEQWIGYLGLTLSVCSALTASMLFLLRAQGRIDRLPLFGIPVVIYVGATLFLAALYGYSHRGQVLVTLVAAAIGLVLYPLVKHRNARTT